MQNLPLPYRCFDFRLLEGKKFARARYERLASEFFALKQSEIETAIRAGHILHDIPAADWNKQGRSTFLVGKTRVNRNGMAHLTAKSDCVDRNKNRPSRLIQGV